MMFLAQDYVLEPKMMHKHGTEMSDGEEIENNESVIDSFNLNLGSPLQECAQIRSFH